MSEECLLRREDAYGKNAKIEESANVAGSAGDLQLHKLVTNNNKRRGHKVDCVIGAIMAILSMF